MDAEYIERTMFYLKDFLKVPDTNTEFAAKKAYKAAFPLNFKDAVEMLKKQSRTQKGESTNEAIAEYMHMTPRTFTDALSNPAVHMNPYFVLALCLYPALFINTFVSQGAHWRTDAHNGKLQNLWFLQTTAVFRVDIVCLRAFFAVRASAASAFLAERNDYGKHECNRPEYCCYQCENHPR